jgi:hypothetical protein
LASCGSGTLTHAEFVAKANAICKVDVPEQDRLSNELDAASDDVAKAGQILDRMVALIRQQRTKLAALKPPASDQAKVEELLGLYDHVASLFHTLKTDMQAEDLQAINDLEQQGTALGDKGTQLAGELGLTECQ